MVPLWLIVASCLWRTRIESVTISHPMALYCFPWSVYIWRRLMAFHRNNLLCPRKTLCLQNVNLSRMNKTGWFYRCAWAFKKKKLFFFKNIMTMFCSSWFRSVPWSWNMFYMRRTMETVSYRGKIHAQFKICCFSPPTASRLWQQENRPLSRSRRKPGACLLHNQTKTPSLNWLSNPLPISRLHYTFGSRVLQPMPSQDT